MVQIGESFPEYEVDAFHDGKIKKINFGDYLGKWIVLFAYSGDFTFVAPGELEEAARLYDEFKKCNAEIMSVSTDSVYSHIAWHASSPSIKKITFPMISDTAGKLSRELNVYNEEEGAAFQGSFIIDPEGKMIMSEIHENTIGRNIAETLRKLQAAKIVRENQGSASPVNWQPGQPIIKKDISFVGKI